MKEVVAGREVIVDYVFFQEENFTGLEFLRQLKVSVIKERK